MFSEPEEEESLETLTLELSRRRRSSTVLDIQEEKCCCGRDECAFLVRSQNVLAELEKDVQTAATLGQALLRRHEQSMAEAERERNRMNGLIADLERKTRELEMENTKTIEENKSLLNTLEDLNNSMSLNDSGVSELQEDLGAAHAELSRLAATAARTELLEAQLAALEMEQDQLRNTLATTKQEERCAVARWKKAERTLGELEQQVERIERENALENARSKNLLERLEQRRYSDCKNEPFPTPSAGAALNGFMKEILAENGHLQLGITELRDMLVNSQEEVNVLKEQLEMMNHQKLERDGSPLSQELGHSPSGNMQTIVHHHHYHNATTGREKAAFKSQIRRPKKRRNVISPANPNSRRPLEVGGSSPPAPFSQRWSIQSRATSGGTTSSFDPASPVSTFQESSVFDRHFDHESSRPTSADSNYRLPLAYGKRTFPKKPPTTSGPPFSILHVTDEVPSDYEASIKCRRPKLRRSESHESMFSVMDRQGRYTVSPALSVCSFSGRSPSFTASTAKSPQAIITPGVAIRYPSTGYGSSAYSHLLGLQEGSSSNPPVPKAVSRKTSSSSIGSNWFWRWGASPSSKTNENLAPSLKNKKTANRPSVLEGFVNENLLQESLREVQGLS